jgi:TonB family protein
VELTLIDDQPRPKSTLGYSFVIHVFGIAFAIIVPLFMTDVIKAPEHHYSVISLVNPRPIPKMAAPKVKLPPPKLVVNKQELPKLTLPKVERPTPAPAPPVLAHFDSPKILPSPPQNSLPRLVPSVHTGVLTGSSAPATVKAPVRKVQTGGFGDPNGLAPSSNSKGDGKLVMARLGNFDLPPGPGYGNGSGGAHGIRGTVASAGFGSSIAGPGQGGGQSGSPRGGGIHASGFEQAQVQETPKPRAVPTAGPTKPVEITYKPNPIYTDEARALKLEGDVLLDVIFGANGQIQILHVARGLGHGLDEAAVRSAQQIRFKPAMRDGQPVDSEATLHVRFQLAY